MGKRPKTKKRERTAIRKLRKYLGFTVENLARTINVSIYTVTSWDSGIHSPGPEGIRRLRTAFVEAAISMGKNKEKAIDFVDERLLSKDSL